MCMKKLLLQKAGCTSGDRRDDVGGALDWERLNVAAKYVTAFHVWFHCFAPQTRSSDSIRLPLRLRSVFSFFSRHIYIYTYYSLERKIYPHKELPPTLPPLLFHLDFSEMISNCVAFWREFITNSCDTMAYRYQIELTR